MKSTPWNRTHACLALTAALTACGGGSSDTAAPPAEAALSLSGTATNGTAIANKSVEAKCATGVGTANTGTDGTYTLSIGGGRLPCLARITTADGTVLHTVATGTGGTATANLTPVTNLVVARLAAAEPTTYYATFDPTAAAAVTGAATAAAQTSVVATLKNGGVDLTSLGELVSVPVTPAYITALTTLAGTLTAAGTTFAQLTSAIAVGASSTPTAAASLPADLQLKTAASNCSALRSGSYRIVRPFEGGTTLPGKYDTIAIDAATLSLIFKSGVSNKLVATGPCTFSGNSGKTSVVVSQAGVITARYTEDNGATYHPLIAFPVQAHALAELAGTWNVMGMNTDAGLTSYYAIAASGTFDGTGRISGVSGCANPVTWSVATCVAQPDNGSTRRINGDGGYDVVESNGYVSGRGFVYQAGGGELMIVEVYDRGDFIIFTRQRTNTLPAVGALTASWNLSINGQLAMPGVVTAGSNVIASVDAAAGSYVRTQKSIPGTNDHPETILLNSPRSGYNFRAAGSALAADGSTVTFSEITVLSLRGMGLSALVAPVGKTFGLSTTQP